MNERMFGKGALHAQNIFSTILKLASLQIRNSPSAQTSNLRSLPFAKNCYRKNLNSLSELPSQTSGGWLAAK